MRRGAQVEASELPFIAWGGSQGCRESGHHTGGTNGWPSQSHSTFPTGEYALCWSVAVPHTGVLLQNAVLLSDTLTSTTVAVHVTDPVMPWIWIRRVV